jgi:hypothetical protein
LEAHLLKISKKMEVFKKINSISNKHTITNYGRCFVEKSNGKMVQTGSLDAYGYVRVFIDGKYLKVHRLVAEYFLDNFSKDLTINHKDFNKQNNHVDNLEAITANENLKHYYENKKKLTTTSRAIGVSYHKGLNKWVTRKTIDGKRYNLGVFDTEKESIEALNTNDLKIGKGKSNIGKSKYSFEDKKNAVLLANEIGVRRAGVETGMGSTQISILRKSEEFKHFYIRD